MVLVPHRTALFCRAVVRSMAAASLAAMLLEVMGRVMVVSNVHAIFLRGMVTIPGLTEGGASVLRAMMPSMLMSSGIIVVAVVSGVPWMNSLVAIFIAVSKLLPRTRALAMPEHLTVAQLSAPSHHCLRCPRWSRVMDDRAMAPRDAMAIRSRSWRADVYPAMARRPSWHWRKWWRALRLRLRQWRRSGLALRRGLRRRSFFLGRRRRLIRNGLLGHGLRSDQNRAQECPSMRRKAHS